MRARRHAVVDDGQLTAWTYARQSKDHDAGIGRQQDDTDHHAGRRGWVIPDGGRFADNDVSATKSRAGTDYARLMELIKAGHGPQVLIVTYMDRLYRQPIELEQIIPVFERARILIAPVYEGDVDLSTDSGQTFARITVALARQEVMRKARRQKRANLERAQRGERSPHTIRPFGWADDRVSLNEPEAEAIRWACPHVLAGGSVAAVNRNWTQRGVQPRFAGRTYRSRDGKVVPFSSKWSNSSIVQILTNPTIAGLMTLPNSDDIIGTGNWTPIISPETFYAVRDVLRDPTRATPRGAVSLGGFLYYCRCGALVQGDTRTTKRKGEFAAEPPISYPIYKCQEYTQKREGRPGPHVALRAAPVDTYVTEKILDRMRSPDAADIFAHRAGAEDVPKLKAERKEISDGLARMAGDEALGILPRAIYLDAAKRVTARLEEIDARIAEAGQMDAAALLIGVDDPADIWPDLDVTIQRKIIDSLVHVTLRPAGCGCRNPDMEKLVRVAWRKG
jgi:DNA invertase Pin-like site-specific DNA recombinase